METNLDFNHSQNPRRALNVAEATPQDHVADDNEAGRQKPGFVASTR